MDRFEHCRHLLDFYLGNHREHVRKKELFWFKRKLTVNKEFSSYENPATLVGVLNQYTQHLSKNISLSQLLEEMQAGLIRREAVQHIT
jgi:hypothetical protein